MSEPVDLKKWFGSFFQAVPWLKDLRTYVGLVIIVIVFVTVYRAFFMKNQTQSQHFVIYPFSFSHVDYAPQQSQKQEIKKRAWWLPIFFVEAYGFSETTGRVGLGGRAGGKLEF